MVGFVLSHAGKSHLFSRPTITSQSVSTVSFSDLILWWVRVYNRFEGKVYISTKV